MLFICRLRRDYRQYGYLAMGLRSAVRRAENTAVLCAVPVVSEDRTAAGQASGAGSAFVHPSPRLSR